MKVKTSKLMFYSVDRHRSNDTRIAEGWFHYNGFLCKVYGCLLSNLNLAWCAYISDFNIFQDVSFFVWSALVQNQNYG